LPTVYYVTVSSANTKVFSGVGEQLSQQGTQLGTAADRLSDLGKDLRTAASNLNTVAGLLPGGGP